MDSKIFIIILIVGIVIYFIIKDKFIKKTTTDTLSKSKFKQSKITDELTFLKKDYEKEKLNELKYLTSQHDSSDDDIKSTELL